jgi:hypothetical protein
MFRKVSKKLLTNSLAEKMLLTIRVPQSKGVLERVPRSWDSRKFPRKLRSRGIKPTIPTYERRQRKPRRGRPVCLGTAFVVVESLWITVAAFLFVFE